MSLFTKKTWHNGPLGGTPIDEGGLNDFETRVDTAIAAVTPALVPTAVKSASYTAAVQDLVPFDVTSGSKVLTLPTAPADGSRVAVKVVALSGSNTLTVTAGGSDVFNKASGATSVILSLLNQAVTLQYKASGGIWYVVSDDVPLSALNATYEAYGSAAWLIGRALSQAFRLTANQVYDTSFGTLTASDIAWPDGTTGHYATTGLDTAGAVTGFTVTYVGATTKTVTVVVPRNASSQVSGAMTAAVA